MRNSPVISIGVILFCGSEVSSSEKVIATALQE
jgi:hypothetical protein